MVAGGIHITAAQAFVPQGCFDAICVGMAEGTWPQLLLDFQNGCLAPVYKCAREFSGADIVSPAYDLINSADYLYCNIVHTSRGCPFRCDFCYNSAEAQHYLNRPIADVLSDINAVNSRHIMFIDDNFVGNIAWTREFLVAVMPLKLKWNAAVSINIIDHLDLLDQMRESGCQSLFIGLESISTSSLKSVNKIQNDVGKYEFAVREIHKRGIMINASFVFGLDCDTPEIFKKTLDWIVENKIETVTSHIVTPYPGTTLYANLLREGRISKSDLSLYNTASVVFKPKCMTADELYSGYLWLYKNIYSFKNIIRRVPEHKNQILPYLAFNLFYRKCGKATDFVCKLVSYKHIGILGEKLSRYLK